MIRKLLALAPVLALAATVANAQAAPQASEAQTGRHTSEKADAALAKGDPHVRSVLLLMDADKDGKVSRAEFMTFMSAEFDRLDINKDGQLDVNELTALRISSKHPGGGSK